MSSQIVKDVIKTSQNITKKMQKVIKKKEKERLKKLKAEPKPPSVVAEFIKKQERFKPKLTPAEKGANTKERNRLIKEYQEALIREKEQMELWAANMKIRKKRIEEAYGSSESSLR